MTVAFLGLDIGQLIETYGYAAVFLLVGLESVGVPLPGETALITAAIYAGTTGRLEIGVVVALAAAAAIIGDNIGYLLGRWGGFRLLTRYGRYIRLHEQRVKIGRYIFLRHGGKVVFFGRFVSLLRTYAAFLAGTNRMPWRRFLLFNTAGGIAWACLIGLGYYYLGAILARLQTPVDIALAAIAAAVVIAFLLYLRRAEHRLAAKAERAFPGPLNGGSTASSAADSGRSANRSTQL